MKISEHTFSDDFLNKLSSFATLVVKILFFVIYVKSVIKIITKLEKFCRLLSHKYDINMIIECWGKIFLYFVYFTIQKLSLHFPLNYYFICKVFARITFFAAKVFFVLNLAFKKSYLEVRLPCKNLARSFKEVHCL